MARYRRTRRSRRPLRRSRRRPRRSSFRRRRRNIVKSNRISHLGYLAPRRLRMTTTYSTDLASVTTAGGWEEYVFNGSGLYDTDVAVGGHQPLLFDQMMAIYDYYFVRASKVQVDIMPQATGGGTSNGTVYFKPTTSSGDVMSSMTLTQLREQPNVKMRRWNYYWGTGNSVSSGIVWHKNIQRTWSVLNNDCAGSVSTNPTDNVYHHIVFVNSDESSALNIKVRFKLTYWVEYFNVDEFIVNS